MAITTFGTAFGRSTSEVLLDEARKLPKRNSRKHTLLLLSCYIDPERIQNLLENLLGIVKLTNVHLSFNISEAFRIGPASVKSQMKTLGEWCKSKRVKLKWQALCAGTLVHSKGYSLYQTGKDANEVLAGFFLVGSPNLTKPGFFEARNIELGYISDNLDELVSFINTYDELAERFGKDIDDEVFKQNQALFRFSLLSEGIFLHKWDGSLSKLVGIRYQMTAEGRRNTQLAQEFVELGIEPGNSVTLQPIGLKYLPQKTISSGFVRKYTVDTLLGRWCPLDVWRTVAESIENKTNFLAQFRDATKPERMKEVLEKAQSIQTRLLERQLIT